jgi:hypothetical protein
MDYVISVNFIVILIVLRIKCLCIRLEPKNLNHSKLLYRVESNPVTVIE